MSETIIITGGTMNIRNDIALFAAAVCTAAEPS